jgi:eukaryotic-like serine/threonine-protein kinase
VSVGSSSPRDKLRSLPVKVTSGAHTYAPEPLVVPFAQGDVIADKYEIVGLLGAGGVAYVLSALHLELHEMVALKFLRPESLAMPDVVARFASEARAVAKLKSEHVAHVYDVGTLPDGAPYIVMEYLEGRDLADVLAEQRRLPVKLAVDYVLQACEALACAHVLGIVHRDIKPENLYLSQAGSVERIKVLDFGISKNALVAHPQASDRASAKTMLPMGTPGYMSPEQVRACGSVDARTDIWALGCVLSELITGTSTFEAPTQVQLGAVILEADPVPLRQKLSDAPAELEAIVMRCLAKNPDDRFQDVAELALALYPFGRRRARLSAERCHQVLHGAAGGEFELNSVVPPPQSGDTPTRVAVADLSAPPRSGRVTIGAASGAPLSAPSAEMLGTNAPATLSSADAMLGFRPRRRWPLVAVAVLGLAAVAGVALRLRVTDVQSGADAASAAARGMSTTTAASTAVAPAAAPARPAGADEQPLQKTAEPANSAKPESAATTATAPASKANQAQAQRAAAAAAKRQAAAVKAAKAAAAKAAAGKRAATLDDSEPDVGY